MTLFAFSFSENSWIATAEKGRKHTYSGRVVKWERERVCVNEIANVKIGKPHEINEKRKWNDNNNNDRKNEIFPPSIGFWWNFDFLLSNNTLAHILFGVARVGCDYFIGMESMPATRIWLNAIFIFLVAVSFEFLCDFFKIHSNSRAQHRHEDELTH